MSSPIIVIATPLFSKFGAGAVSICMVLWFFTVQLLGIYIFAPIVMQQPAMPIDQRILLGGLNGTVLGYAMLLTLVVLLLSISLIVYWRSSVVNKNSHTTKINSHQLVSANAIATTEKQSLIGQTVKHYLALYPFSWKIGLGMIGAWAIYLIAGEALMQALGKDPSAFVDALYFSAHPRWLLIFGMVIAAPIYEEWLFRGIIWSALREQLAGKRGVWLASIISSVIFAIIHLQYDTYEMGIIFFLALLLSYARYKSGSLWLPVLIHILNNGVAMLQYLYFR